MKKIFVLCSAVLLAAALLLGGCKVKKDAGTTAPAETTAVDALPTEDASVSQTEEAEAVSAPAETEPPEIPTQGDPELLSDGQTVEIPINDYLPDTANWSAMDWISFADARYQEACKAYYTCLCTDGWLQTDDADTTFGGYRRVTNYNDMAGATAAFYDVFSTLSFGNAFDGILLEKDGKLYARPETRAADSQFVSGQVVSLEQIGNGTVQFVAAATYADGSIRETYFQLLYERGAFRVYDFTQPY